MGDDSTTTDAPSGHCHNGHQLEPEHAYCPACGAPAGRTGTSIIPWRRWARSPYAWLTAAALLVAATLAVAVVANQGDEQQAGSTGVSTAPLSESDKCVRDVTRLLVAYVNDQQDGTEEFGGILRSLGTQSIPFQIIGKGVALSATNDAYNQFGYDAGIEAAGSQAQTACDKLDLSTDPDNPDGIVGD